MSTSFKIHQLNGNTHEEIKSRALLQAAEHFGVYAWEISERLSVTSYQGQAYTGDPSWRDHDFTHHADVTVHLDENVKGLEHDESALTPIIPSEKLAPWEIELLVNGDAALKERVVSLLRQSKKIQAIKEVRFADKRIGLRDAKHFVDDLQNNLPKLEDTATIVSVGGREMILRPDPYSDNEVLLHVFPRKDGDLFPHDFFMNFNREEFRLFVKEVLG